MAVTLLLVSFGSLNPSWGGQAVHTKIVGGNCATYIGTAATGYEVAMTTFGTTDYYGQQSCNLMYLDHLHSFLYIPDMVDINSSLKN